MIDYVTLSLFYATDISFIFLLTCVDNKPLKHCKISVARLLEQCENAYRCNYASVQLCIILLVLVGIYGYIRYEFVLQSTAIFFNGIGLKIIVLCSLRLE